jgi:triosephosphate isomerase
MKFRPLVVANWKMNPTNLKEANLLGKALGRLSLGLKKIHLVIAPPAIYFSAIKPNKKVFLGAQNVFWDKKGAYTGEISPTQLSERGVSYVIIGHSERRTLGEGDDMVNKKVRAVLAEGMTPIICIGELEHDSQGKYLAFLSHQIKASLKGMSKSDITKSVLAYEPVWAIGKDAKDAMKANDLHETVLYIQKVLSEIYGRAVAHSIPILYGGSVKEDNAESLMREGAVSGFLVGGGSLSSKTFAPIVKAVESSQS